MLIGNIIVEKSNKVFKNGKLPKDFYKEASCVRILRKDRWKIIFTFDYRMQRYIYTSSKKEKLIDEKLLKGFEIVTNFNDL